MGQGDSIFVQTPFGQNIIIDGGPDQKALQEIDKILPWWDQKIDLMILTHPHDDHVSGLINILNHYKVKKIIYTGALHTSPNFLSWLEEIKKEKIDLISPLAPNSIYLGDHCVLQIFYPLESFWNKKVDNLNNTSLVIKLIYKDTSFLFAGDIEKEVEEELIQEYCLPSLADSDNFYCQFKNSKFNLRANVFKANHHGSDTSNTTKFLKAINPEIAVISVGQDNKFGHPSQRVLNRFFDMAIRVFRTDIDGVIIMESNGDFINIK